MSAAPTVSVITIVRGREAHLANLVAGLACQTILPDELVIGWMQEAPGVVSPASFPVRDILVPGDPMPLAAARNRAVAAATGDELILLDVDCIPSPTLVERYRETAPLADVRLGEVHYLPPGSIDPADGMRHPAKPAIDSREVRPVPDHGELWGLSFALSAEAWRRAGGMDERYVGYGGEETDFAWRLEASGLGMAWIGGALAWHQHHPVHVPPLHQFDAILRNARLFHVRWGRWCMDYWLGQFAEAGLIALRADEIEVLRHPTDTEIAASLRPDLRFS